MTSDSALILKNCWKYLKCSPDLIVSAKGCEYKVHTIVLFCLSPYFQKLFHYRSKSSDGYYRLDMKDVSDYIMAPIINFAYNGQIYITHENVEELVIIADKYNIIAVMNRCEQFLWQKLNEDNCFEIYLLSHYYNCYHLKAFTERFIIDNKVLPKQNGHTLEALTPDLVIQEWNKRNKQ